MKKHFDIILSRFLRLLLSILGMGGILGLTGCDRDEPVAEYGAPVGKFKVTGTVSDAGGNGIEGIGVVLHQNDTVFSDSTGAYATDVFDNPESQTYVLKFSDRDGTNNGAYLPKDTTVVFSNPHFVNGEVEKTVNVILEEDN